ncbi:MbtH family NRPS accessory protein [Kitasatospora sp. NPDC001574]
MSDTAADRTYQVVVNQEEQYSIWDADRRPPEGWRAAGFTGDRRQAPEQPGEGAGAAERLAHRAAEGAQEEGGDDRAGQGGQQPAAEVEGPVAPGQTEIEHVDSFSGGRRAAGGGRREIGVVSGRWRL